MGKEITTFARESGQRIRQFRKGKGLTQEKFAEILGVSESTVKKWERGENLISINSLHRMHELWGVSADFILYGNCLDAEDIIAIIENMEKTDQLIVILRCLGYITGTKDAVSAVKGSEELLLSIRDAVRKNRKK